MGLPGLVLLDDGAEFALARMIRDSEKVKMDGAKADKGRQRNPFAPQRPVVPAPGAQIGGAKRPCRAQQFAGQQPAAARRSYKWGVGIGERIATSARAMPASWMKAN